jgi:hypothetical protein
MRRWLALAAALSFLFMCVSSALGADGIVVQGVIANWKDVKERVPASAYFQLVKYTDKMKGTSDEEGYAAFDSKLPKIKVRDDGSFKLSVKELPQGNYFIALQRAIPKEVYGEAVASAIPLLITEKQEALVIQVPGKFPANVGKVLVAVRGHKKPEASEKTKKEPSPPTPEKE